MAKNPVVKITWLGDATSAQQSAKAVGDAVSGAEVKVEGFGVAFAKFAAQIAALELLRRGGEAVLDYTNKVNAATISIGALTRSQEAVAEATAIANRELAAGRAAYSDTIQLLAQLTPTALRTGQSIDSLYQTALLLSTLNNGPGGGVEGAIVAISEALSGDWTSAIERFNLPRAEINRLKAEGVPALEILNRTLAQSGVTMDTVNAQSKSAGNQWHIFLDTLARTAAEAGPVKTVLGDLTEALNLLNTGLNTGTLWEDFVVTGEKALVVLLDRYNDLAQAISGGRLNFDAQVRDLFRNVSADDAALQAKRKIADPIVDAVGGAQTGQRMQQAGADMLLAYLDGLTAAGRGAFGQISKLTEDLFKDDKGKTNADALARANAVLARAMQELATTGQFTDETMRDLSEAYGLQAGEVVRLIQADQALIVAQSRQAAGQAGVNVATASGDAIVAGYTQRLDEATRAAEQHSRAHEGVIDALGRESAAIQRAADDRQRAYQDETQALQEQAAAQQAAAQSHAAASQAAVAAAQSEVTATRDRAAAHSGLLTAALRGETEEYLKQLDVIDDETRAIADRYETEVGGIRRARDAANQQVTNLNRAQNRENLDYLTRIDAARKSGNERQARALERELAARQQSHRSENEIARARAAVAGDEFDVASAHLTKEAQAQQVQDTAATRAAEKRLGEVQDQAEAQRAADDAALRAIQGQIAEVGRRQQADQRATQDRQRAIQDELDLENRRYAIVAAGDRNAQSALAALIGDRKTYWSQEQTQLGTVNVMYASQVTYAERARDAARERFEWVQKEYDLYRTNPVGSPTGPPAYVVPPGRTGTSPYDETPPWVPQGPNGQPTPTPQPGPRPSPAPSGQSGYDIWQDVVRGGSSTVRG